MPLIMLSEGRQFVLSWVRFRYDAVVRPNMVAQLFDILYF